MPTPITEEEWKELVPENKIIGQYGRCCTVTRHHRGASLCLVRPKGYDFDVWLEFKNGEILCEGSPVEELNHPDAKIVPNPISPQSQPGP